MSVDGDLQGVPRILDALSAHMWPGLVMKSTQKLTDVRPDSKEGDEGAVSTFFSLISIVGGSEFCSVRLSTSRVCVLSLYVVHFATQFALEVQDMLVAAYGWTEFLFDFLIF